MISLYAKEGFITSVFVSGSINFKGLLTGHGLKDTYIHADIIELRRLIRELRLDRIYRKAKGKAN